MSGGSCNYICFTIEEELVGRMHDTELDMLAKDFADLAHALEWWTSGDTGEEEYRAEVRKFKSKWFGGNNTARLEGIINDRCDQLRSELMKVIER